MNKNYSNYSKKYFDNVKNSGKGFTSDFFFAACIIVAIFLVFFIVPRFFYEVVKVDGSSMLPTIQHEDKVGIYRTKKVNFGDIAVIDAEGLGLNPKINYIIKRVIGLEGDTIWLDYYNEAEEYRIYRLKNGETEADILDEPYINGKMNSLVLSKEYKVPAGYVFVIGDNRNDTYKDVVPLKNILGKGVTILTKTSTFKFIGIEFNWYNTKWIKNLYKAT